MVARRRLGSVLALAAATVLMAEGPKVLPREPASGQLSPGETVLVDDGSCPPGQIKQVVGGSNQGKAGGSNRQGAPRTRACVPRGR